MYHSFQDQKQNYSYSLLNHPDETKFYPIINHFPRHHLGNGHNHDYREYFPSHHYHHPYYVQGHDAFYDSHFDYSNKSNNLNNFDTFDDYGDYHNNNESNDNYYDDQNYDSGIQHDQTYGKNLIMQLEEFLNGTENGWLIAFMKECGHCQKLMDSCNIDHNLPPEHLNQLYQRDKSTFFISTDQLGEIGDLIDNEPDFERLNQLNDIETVPQIFKCSRGQLILQPPNERENFIQFWNSS